MKYITKRKIYKNKWNKRHRRQINKARKTRRRLKQQHVNKLENQVKVIPKLKDKISDLHSQLANSRGKLIDELKLKKQINQLEFKVQFLNQFKTKVTKDYILIKFSSNKKSRRINLLENELSQLDTLKSKNKSLASKCSSAASIIRANKSKSANEMSSNKSFLMGKGKKGLFSNLF